MISSFWLVAKCVTVRMGGENSVTKGPGSQK